MLARLRRCCSCALHFGGVSALLWLCAVAPARAGEAFPGGPGHSGVQQSDKSASAATGVSGAPTKKTAAKPKSTDSPSSAPGKKAATAAKHGSPTKKSPGKTTLSPDPQSNGTHKVPSGPVRNGTSRLINGTTPANATFKDGWIIMEPGSRPAYVGIHGGTAPVSLHSANGTLFAFTGQTGNDFIHVLQGSAPNPGAAQQKKNNSTDTPPANATDGHISGHTAEAEQESTPATNVAPLEGTLPTGNATAAPVSPSTNAPGDAAAGSAEAGANPATAEKNSTIGSSMASPAAAARQRNTPEAASISLPSGNGTSPEQQAVAPARKDNGTPTPAALAPSPSEATGTTPQRAAAPLKSTTAAPSTDADAVAAEPRTATLATVVPPPADDNNHGKNASLPVVPLKKETPARPQPVPAASAVPQNGTQLPASGKKDTTLAPASAEADKTTAPQRTTVAEKKAQAPLELAPAGKLAPLPPEGKALPADAKAPLTAPTEPATDLPRPPLAPSVPAAPAKASPAPAKPAAPPASVKETTPPAPARSKEAPAPAKAPALQPTKGSPAAPAKGTPPATPSGAPALPAPGQTAPASGKVPGTFVGPTAKEQPAELVFATGDQASRISKSTEELLPFGLQSPDEQTQEEALSIAAVQQAKTVTSLPPLKLRGYNAVLSHCGPL